MTSKMNFELIGDRSNFGANTVGFFHNLLVVHLIDFDGQDILEFVSI